MKINKCLRKCKLWKENEFINKITISTQIAQQSTPSETPVPDWCTNFSDMFLEQTHAKLPPHRHYDHTIDLQPTFTSCIAKIHPLNPAELQTCKEFIDKHLKMGWIIPSKSPQASPFFLYPRKTDPYALAKITNILIPTLFEMHTLCHSSQNSSMI